MALLASALLRLTRGFISMTSERPVSGSTANCTLLPPVTTPTASSTFSESLRRRWNSRSVSVCAGATVTLSPVCTPIASKFSMLQTMMPLPAWSRMTSSSYSFQPSTDSSTSTLPTGEAATPSRSISRSSASSWAMPLPAPPSVKLARRIIGNDSSASARGAWSSAVSSRLRGVSRPMSAMRCLNSSRSSASRTVRGLAPISSTPWRSRMPRSASSTARFRPVCPPTVGSSASGFSAMITCSSISQVSGST